MGVPLHRLVLMLATLATACGPRVTATQCWTADKCEQESELCHNSCSLPNALPSCGTCCQQNRKKCLDCDGPFTFNRCD
jgi:hypothetical protein